MAGTPGWCAGRGGRGGVAPTRPGTGSRRTGRRGSPIISARSAASCSAATPPISSTIPRGAGEPYRDKLLRLPGFLLDGTAQATARDIGDGLALTGFFLSRHVLEPFGRTLPAARARFVDRMGQEATIAGGQLSEAHD